MNALETKIKTFLEKQGWTVLRCGWPDFLLFKESNAGTLQAACVEVKSTHDDLSDEQRSLHKILKAVGLPVHVIREEFIAKGRLGKTIATLTAAERLNLYKQTQELANDFVELSKRITAHLALLEQTTVITEPSDFSDPVPCGGNLGVTKPAEGAVLFRALYQELYEDAKFDPEAA